MPPFAGSSAGQGIRFCVLSFMPQGALPLLMAATFLAGLCISGGQKSVISLAAVFYPASVRSTGVGWALGMGRIGSIVGPMVGGVLLSLKWSVGELFVTAAAAALCAALAAFSLSRMAGLGGRGKGAPDHVPSLEAVTRAQA